MHTRVRQGGAPSDAATRAPPSEATASALDAEGAKLREDQLASKSCCRAAPATPGNSVAGLRGAEAGPGGQLLGLYLGIG